MGRAINNTNVERNTTLTMTDTGLKPTASRANNDTDDEIQIGMSAVSITTIKYTDTQPTIGEGNNDMDDKVDIDTLDTMGVAIKDTVIEHTAVKANNDIEMEFNTCVFMSGTINKTDVELNISRLDGINTIIEKEVYKSNLF